MNPEYLTFGAILVAVGVVAFWAGVTHGYRQGLIKARELWHETVDQHVSRNTTRAGMRGPFGTPAPTPPPRPPR